MSKVAIVTDSTAYIPPEMMRGLPIYSVPLQVIWEGKVYQDGIDITPAEFYERLKKTTSMPTTSQPTPQLFTELYSKLLDEGYDILSIHISAKLSGTLDSAIQARNALDKDRIVLFDSEFTTMAMGFQILTAARAAIEGATLQECHQLAEEARNRCGAIFVVDTLEFLHRGGRIGGAAALFGTAFNIKPILEVRDGRVEPLERVRTKRKALLRLLDIATERISKDRPVRIASLVTDNPAEAQSLLDQLRSRFNVSDVSDALCAPISPVLGTHTGPGTLGFAYLSGM
ncbi:MAG: DegV family protein [Chloroflexi bacterium]|nr:DegV family protein [Chloroflexota bacterium]